MTLSHGSLNFHLLLMCSVALSGLHVLALPPWAVSLSLCFTGEWLWGTTALTPPLYPIILLLICLGGNGQDSCLEHHEGQGHPQSLRLPWPIQSDYSDLSLSWLLLMSYFWSTISSELFCHLSPGSLLPVTIFLPLLAWLLMRAICSTCCLIQQEQTRCTRQKSIHILFIDWAVCFQISAHMYCHWFMFLQTTVLCYTSGCSWASCSCYGPCSQSVSVTVA